MMNSISYLRVTTPSDEHPEQKEVKQEVLKFVTWIWVIDW